MALNSVGVNISRAVGPALAGIIIAAWGMAASFWLNAVSNLAVIAALMWWRPQQTNSRSNVPAERLVLAVGAGLRYARHNPHLRATQMRALGFFIFAALIGRFYHWSPGIKFLADLPSTASCLEPSASAQ